MKLTLSSILLGLSFTAVAACGSKGDDLVGKVTGFKNQICACADEACAGKVEEAYKAWRKEARKGPKPAEDVITKLQGIEKEMRACGEKFDKPADPPAAPPTEPPPTPVAPPADGSAAAPADGSATP
ncbi:MAG: hypothetical protein R2939_07660 [Kofleriaceae bacterium]